MTFKSIFRFFVISASFVSFEVAVVFSGVKSRTVLLYASTRGNTVMRPTMSVEMCVL